MSTSKHTLRKELGLLALVAYGVGDILGAGIYALVGKIAGVAGSASNLAFLVSLVVAMLTALSYAELGGRFPRSGGEAFFCQQGFQRPSIAFVVGWLVICSGVMSMATVSRAFGDHLSSLFGKGVSEITESIGVVLLVAAVSIINFRGIRESSRLNLLCTAIEMGGLAVVIVAGAGFLLRQVGNPGVVADQPVWPPWFGIAQASALAFFAFIGFEDMVNVAEEVRDAERNLPIGIILALLIAGSIYIVVVSVATSVVPPQELAASKAPLVEVVRRAAPAVPIALFTVVALFAVANTGLLNAVMASRLLYGMAEQRLLPAWLGRIHARTRTPYRAIGVIFVAVTVVALSGTLTFLAGAASVLILVVFLAVNASLVLVKRQDTEPPSGFRVPCAVPVLAACCCLALIGFLPARSILTAGAAILVGVILNAVRAFWRQ